MKIAVIGCGFVGSTFAYTVVLRGLAEEIILVDANAAKAEGEAMDLNHGLAYAQATHIRAGGYPEVAGADLVVITAGANQKPGETRLDLLRRNAGILLEVTAEVVRYNQQAILLVATNPVDLMTQVAGRVCGFPAGRVIGSGTILDTGRLRFLLGQRLVVDPRSVHANILGEHGDSEFPAWSLSTVAGMPLADYAHRTKQDLDHAELEGIFQEVRGAAYQIIQRKGATYYAIALGLCRLVEAIRYDQHSVLTVSTRLDGHYGLRDICLGVPAVIGRAGVEEVLEVPLANGEMEALQRSAAVLKEAAASAGLA